MAMSLLRSAIRVSGKRRALLALALVAAVAVGCYNNNTGQTNVGEKIVFKLPAFPESGQHRVVVFTEMHYQPSFRPQEVPRMFPPFESVPVTGRDINYIAEFENVADFRQLDIPAEVVQGYDQARARRLYEINCLVCHGPNLQGDGPILNPPNSRPDYSYNATLPANLTRPETQSAANGELFGFISGGGRQGLAARIQGVPSPSPMPEFRLLLTEEERWTLVQYLRNPTGGP